MSAVELDPGREAIGLSICYLEDEDEADDQVVNRVLERFQLSGDELGLVAALLALVSWRRDSDFLDELYGLALERARRR